MFYLSAFCTPYIFTDVFQIPKINSAASKEVNINENDKVFLRSVLIKFQWLLLSWKPFIIDD